MFPVGILAAVGIALLGTLRASPVTPPPTPSAPTPPEASSKQSPWRPKNYLSPNEIDTEEELDIWLLPGKDTLAEEFKDADPTGSTNIRRRRKRKIQNFLPNQDDRKWPVPIFYQFTKTQPERQRDVIRGALSHWREKTCIVFFEVNSGAALSAHHIKFTDYGTRCGSYVGRVEILGKYTQAINLPGKCLDKFGTVVHEIGHALGLWHEHQRPDRDGHIRIVKDNLVSWAHHNFERALSSDIEHYGVPYDFNSVMHYGPKAGTNNGDATLRTIDDKYQSNIGQRVALSFLDAKVINTAYCKSYCTTKLPFACRHGGYQDPRNCGRCRCPDGLSGQYCDQVAPSRGAVCGGLVELREGEQSVISSPGYDNHEPYRNQVECNWIIRAPKGLSVQLKFAGNFSMYCHSGICYHWIEVRYRHSFEAPGPRFCCESRPDAEVNSEGHEMLVTMRSNWTTEDRVARLGFKAYVTAKGGHIRNEYVERAKEILPTPEPVSPHEAASSIRADLKTWSDWSQCSGHDCHCGSCSTQRRHRRCGDSRCSGAEAQSEERLCNIACTSQDRVFYFAGRTYKYECPRCCTGYVKEGFRCLPGK